MSVNEDIINSTNAMSFSTNDVYRGDTVNQCLSDDLDTIEANITSLQTNKANLNHTHSDYMSEDDAVAAFAPINHTHTSYLSEDDAVAAFAPINHTHTGYAASMHTHSDLESLIEALDNYKADANHTHTGYAATDHTHAQSEITGLSAKLTEIDTSIAALQDSLSEPEVEPLLIASMHLGKLDNNSGAEVDSTTRICSDPFAIQNGKSYWQVNDKAVNMYVLIYDADEVFLEYLGNFASGAEIEVSNTSAAYMRIGSLLGEYDLTNEFRIYDVDPSASGESTTTIDAYTKTESDSRFAPITHSHAGYAASDHTHTGYVSSDHTHTELHTHSNKTVLDGITADKVSSWDTAAGSSTTIDAYTKAESDARYAAASHTHADYMTESDAEDAFAPVTHTHSEYITTTTAGNTFAPVTHTHAGYAALNHTHSYNDLTDVPSNQNSYEHPATHPASMITGLATVATSGNYNDLVNKPTSLPADGGDADTVGGKYPSAFANADHTHSTYLPLSGGSLTGNLNVGGILRVNNQQSVYDSGTMITLSTNNRQTMIAGSQVYSKTTIQVSSDERLKENIEVADLDKCVEFINGIDVKTFNYIGDSKPCIGVIAQDLQDSEMSQYFITKQPGEEGYLAVKAADLVFPLIAAVQKLSAEVEYLKSKT